MLSTLKRRMLSFLAYPNKLAGIYDYSTEHFLRYSSQYFLNKNIWNVLSNVCRFKGYLKTMKITQLAILITTILASEVAFAKEWAFDVYLDKNKIGQHTFSLNDANELTSKAKFNVKVLFINAYQYDHKAVEKWQGDCLASLEAHTVENKVTTDIKGKLTDAKFVVDDGKNKQTLPACSMTFAYWNPKILTQTKLLNPQNAEWLDTKITNLGAETIEVKGKSIEATHYKIEGDLAGKSKLKIELWYNANNDWVALKSITPEGYTIHYKLR